MSYRPMPPGGPQGMPQHGMPPQGNYPRQVVGRPPMQGEAQQHTAPARPLPGYGDEVDELGGQGDEMDGISLRDVASVRYVRHHEWMELVLGNAIDTGKIIPPKVLPSADKDGAESWWMFEDAKSLEKKLSELGAEVAELEKQESQGQPEDAKQEFFKTKTVYLRESFGTLPEGAEKDLEKELEELTSSSVVTKERVKRIHPKLGLPEPKRAPTPLPEDNGHQVDDFELNDPMALDNHAEALLNEAHHKGDGDITMGNQNDTDLNDVLNLG